MTRKNYEKFAEILGKNWDHRFLNDLSNDLMNYFQEDNPAFDRELFVRAINGEIDRRRP